MAAGATKLVCKAWDVVLTRLYGEMYDISCFEDESETVYLNLLFASENTANCDLDRGLQCYIDKVTSSLPNPSEYVSSGSNDCSLTVTHSNVGTSCSSAPQVTIS